MGGKCATLRCVRALTDHETRFRVRLSHVRRYRDLTQGHLAARTGLPGMTRTIVNRIETGHRRATVSEFVALCTALGVPLADMIGETPLTFTSAIETRID